MMIAPRNSPSVTCLDSGSRNTWEKQLEDICSTYRLVPRVYLLDLDSVLSSQIRVSTLTSFSKPQASPLQVGSPRAQCKALSNLGPTGHAGGTQAYPAVGQAAHSSGLSALQRWVCTPELSCSLVRGSELRLKVGRMLIS